MLPDRSEDSMFDLPMIDNRMCSLYGDTCYPGPVWQYAAPAGAVPAARWQPLRTFELGQDDAAPVDPHDALYVPDDWT